MKRANSRRIAVILIAIMGLITIIYAVFSVPQKGLTVPINSADVNMDGIELYSATSNADESIITDFAGNKFILKEIEPSGYSIYTYDTGDFIEGSFVGNSPYYNYNKKQLYYLGPGFYYYREGNTVYNIMTQSVESYNTYNGKDFVLNRNLPEQYMSSTPDFNKTYTDTSGYTVINNDFYFRNLTKMPSNNGGSCGVVGLSMLLGYLDLFGNPNIIGSDNYNANPTKSINLSFETDNKKISEKMKIQNLKDMPGTNDSLHQLIFDNYMHTILNIQSEDGYPMAATELEMTFADYKKEQLSSSLSKQIKQTSGALFYTHATPKKLINSGTPCLIITTKADHEYVTNSKNNRNTKGKLYHVMMAYGYSGDKFLVNMGWQSSGSAQTIISNATIHSYYTLEYTGGHVHSYRIKGQTLEFLTIKSRTYYACACGSVIDESGNTIN